MQYEIKSNAAWKEEALTLRLRVETLEREAKELNSFCERVSKALLSADMLRWYQWKA